MPKVKVPLAAAEKVADELMEMLSPLCKKCVIAGSIRRQKSMVSDIEILYIPKMTTIIPAGQLLPVRVSAMEVAISYMRLGGLLALRPSTTGGTSFGPHVKFMVHVPTDIAVDFFATTAKRWYNSLVCKTGGKKSNKIISTAALKMGYSWATSTEGFVNKSTGSIVPVKSEKDVFDFVRLHYLRPEDRP